MGSIPVVLSSSINSVYDRLPVLIVTSWEDVTKDLLNRTLDDFSKKEFDMSRVRFGYWGSQIAQATKRPNLLTEQLPRDRCQNRYDFECKPVSSSSSAWYVVLFVLMTIAGYVGRRYFGKKKKKVDEEDEFSGDEDEEEDESNRSSKATY